MPKSIRSAVLSLFVLDLSPPTLDAAPVMATTEQHTNGRLATAVLGILLGHCLTCSVRAAELQDPILYPITSTTISGYVDTSAVFTLPTLLQSTDITTFQLSAVSGNMPPSLASWPSDYYPPSGGTVSGVTLSSAGSDAFIVPTLISPPLYLSAGTSFSVAFFNSNPGIGTAVAGFSHGLPGVTLMQIPRPPSSAYDPNQPLPPTPFLLTAVTPAADGNLQSVPEPSTITFILIAGAALSVSRWRKHQSGGLFQP